MKAEFKLGTDTGEPSCDIGKCEDCSKSFTWELAIPIQEGDWEHGYWTSYECPSCGGGLEPAMTRKRAGEWCDWSKQP